MIIVACPRCNTDLRVPEKYAGQFGTCKKCGERLHVPVSDLGEEENWSEQPPVPILPTDTPTGIPLSVQPPAVSPVVYPALVETSRFKEEVEVPVRYYRRRPKQQDRDDMDKRFLLGIAGSIALCMGVFAPLFSAPLVGSRNLFANSQEVGGIVLLIGVTSLGIVLVKKYETLWLTGLGGLAMTLREFLKFYHDKDQFKSETQDDPFLADMASAMADIVQIEWGWAVLLVGSILLLASATIHDERT